MADGIPGIDSLTTDEIMQRCRDYRIALGKAVKLIDALIADRPMLAAKMVGTTTLGNHRAELVGILRYDRSYKDDLPRE